MNAIDVNTGRSIKKQSRFKRFWSKVWSGTKKVGNVIIGKTIPQRLFRLYIVIVIVGALFLCAPFCLREININGQWVQANGFTDATGKAGGTHYTFIQALFIACSGFSDTGLTPVPIYLWLNEGGQVVLAILIEVGGIGVVALFYYIWNVFRKAEKIDVGQLFIMQAERGGPKVSDSFRVIKTALLFILSSQVVFMFMFALCFTFIPAQIQTIPEVGGIQGISYNSGVELGTDIGMPLYHHFGNSLWVGFFTTISAMNNAGFDNISANSMAPYRNDWGAILQVLIIAELIIGGLGHFAAFDIIEKSRCKRKNIPYKVTLYTKVAVTVYIIVAVLGLAGAFAFEITNPIAHVDPFSPLKETTIWGNSNQNGEFGDHPIFNKCMCIIFHTFNCRSLGMETVSTKLVCEGSKWVYSALMFIGASPCSTAGGIRTTTLAVIFVTIWCKLCGRKNVFFFKRRISQETVINSFMIFFISLVLLLLGVIVVWSSLPIGYRANTTISYVFVECCSAFGTVGLSAGITSLARWWGLLYLVILMFVGQLGVINSLLSWTKFRPRFNDIQYPYEEIKIG